MVFSGVAASLGSLASGIGGGVGNMALKSDVIGMWANYAANVGVNVASQNFERKLRRLDYIIQQQTLHREDIRDLCELTTGRMDTYLLSGTLILTFCIGWYTDNTMLASDLPAWYNTLFLLSNFTASAYLIFTVWMAMHASVAAKSISVRLLTQWARLTIPSTEDLQAIDEWVLPTLMEFLRCGRDFLPTANKPPNNEDAPGSPAGKGRSFADDRPKHIASKSFEEDEQEDELPIRGMIPEDHFERFLYEQRRWLGYDAYARICMCLGMNQMLQALSYYILGIVWQSSPVSAIISFMAVKMLSGLILQLDVNGLDDGGRRREFYAMLFLYMLPPAVACIILWYPIVLDYHDTTSMSNIILFPIFLVHALWLLYMAYDLYRGVPFRSVGQQHADPHWMPQRLRTISYLCVLQPEQSRVAAEQKIQYVATAVSKLQESRETLGALMEESMIQESLEKKLSNRSRGRSKLAHARIALWRSVEEARRAVAVVGWPDEDAEAEFRRARRILDRYAVWEKAPDICAVLKAFKYREVQGWLTQDEKDMVETATHNFLANCHELGLGVEAVAGEVESLPQVEQEKHIVHIKSYQDLFANPGSVWISTITGDVVDEPKRRNRVASFQTAFEVDLPQWTSSAAQAERLLQPDAFQRQLAARSSRSELTRQLTQNTECSGHTAETQAAAHGPPELMGSAVTRAKAIPDGSIPDERLPGSLVHKMTMGTAALWVVCAFVHAISGILQASGFVQNGPLRPTSFMRTPEEHLRLLPTSWPTPVSFFEVDSLHCHDQHPDQVFVSSKFRTYVAQRFPSGDLAEFAEVYEVHGGAAAVLCFTSMCSALVPEASGRPWVLQPLGNPPRGVAAPVHVPNDWRRIVAAAWDPSEGQQQLRHAHLAAWDGAGVVVADMLQLGSSAVDWSVRPRFRITPRDHEGRDFDRNGRAQGKYEDVRALQIVDEARTLLILRGSGVLDAWNLVNGTLVARWLVGGRTTGSFTAMCYDGAELILSQQLDRGPELVAAELPTEMQCVLLPKGTP